MKDPIIAHTNIKDKIIVENKYNYTVNLTLGIAEGGDFFLFIDFLDLSMEDLKTLAELIKLQKRLSFKSALVDKEKYNITHIVVTNFSTDSNLTMTWECLSDDPNLYDNLIIE